MASPSLNPSGFLQFEDDGCEMNRDRSQPSRESMGITQLNEIVEKYGNTQYKGGDFIELAGMIKWMSRSWNRLAPFAKRDLIKLIMESNSQMSKDILSEYCPKDDIPDDIKESFGDLATINNEQDAITKLSKMLDGMKNTNPDIDLKVVKCNDKMNILVVIVIIIFAIVVGYMIGRYQK
jgi:hypothetical protein